MQSTRTANSDLAASRRVRLTQTYAYYAALIVLGLAASAFGPTLTGLAAHTRATIGQISVLFVLRSLGYLIGSLLAGRLYDRARGHPLMVSVIFVMIACMALIPVIPLLWLLSAVVLVLGMAEGLLDVGGNTLLVWVHRSEMGPYMNGLHFFFGVGAFFSPIIIAAAVLRTGEIYWAYWALALMMLPPAIWLARLPSPQATTTGKADVTHRPAMPVLIGLIAAFDFLYVGAEVGYGSWVSTYAFTLNLATQVSAAYLASGFWGALTAGRLIGIPLATRVSPRTILLVDLLIVLASVALVLALPTSLTALWIGTIGAGLGMASMFPTVLTLAERHMTITGSVTSWFFVGSGLGGMSLPWLIGRMFEPLGAQSAMWAVFITTALDLLIFGVLMLYIRRLARK